MADLKEVYHKPALTLEQQVDLLISKGLTVNDRELAFQCLKNISYYRFSVYCKEFQHHDGSRRNHEFILGSSFEKILNLYIFDRKLRLHLLDAIEQIEVAIKAAISNNVSIRYGSHWFLRDDLFIPQFNHIEFIEKVNQDISKNQSEPILGSWLHTISYLRNLCAHHSRIWNRIFTIKPKILKGYKTYIPQDDQLFAQIFVIVRLLLIISPNSSWKDELESLLTEYSEVRVVRMGFPEQWISLPIWG